MSDQMNHPRRIVEQSAELEPATASSAHRAAARGEINNEVFDKNNGSTAQRRVQQRAVSVEQTGVSADESTAAYSASPASHPRIWRSTLWLSLAAIAIWGVSSSLLTLFELWQQNKAFAIPIAALAILLLTLLIFALAEEARAIQRIDRLKKVQADILQARNSGDLPKLKSTLKVTLDNLELRHPNLLLTFKEASSTRTDCNDYLETLNNLVLLKLDDAADSKIKRHSLMVGTAVAITPHPALDAIIVLWRAQALVREIGELYGLRLTGLSSWRLMKYLFNSALLAAAMDAAGSLVLEEAGRGAIESAGKKAVEGLVVGSRLYRLGVLAQKVCRPIPQ